MSGAYYNEIDPYAAAWLRNLIAAGHIAPGDVDERDIRLVQPAELAGYTQCHFFAGIGVWSHALRLAEWPDDRTAWTGSCPCQPFSSAGARQGHEDERHLWPAWFGLIRESRPVACFGEQVADGDGEAWLDHVGYDLESIDYAVGAVSPAACGFGAPHERQRLFFVADSSDLGRGEGRGCASLEGRAEHERPTIEPAGRGDGNLGDSIGSGLEVRPRAKNGRRAIRGERTAAAPPGVVGGFWSDAQLVYCADDRWRAVEPGTFPLAHGAKARVGRIRAYGNAIVAPVAAEFIRAYMSTHDIARRKS